MILDIPSTWPLTVTLMYPFFGLVGAGRQKRLPLWPLLLLGVDDIFTLHLLLNVC